MRPLSLRALPHRATIRKPGQYNTGRIPGYSETATDVPCKLIPETTSRAEHGLGRMLTGRYQVLFRAGVEVLPGWRLDIFERVHSKTSTETKGIGTYEVETAVSCATHVEAILIRQT
jgi:hypothetical protein